MNKQRSIVEKIELRRGIAMIAMAVLMICTAFCSMTDQAMAFSGKKGSVYTVTSGERIVYGEGEGGYSNSKLTDLDDGLGTRYSYCVQPDKPSPTATRVTVDKVVTDDADTGKWNALRNIIYYSPSYPGYEENVKNVRDNYYTGDFSKDWGIAHLALSYVYAGRPDDMATYNGTSASDLGEVWTKAKRLGNALWKDGTSRDDAVPENFKVFISYMDGVQDMVVGYLEAPGNLKITKTGLLTSITEDNDLYDLAGAEFTVYDDEEKARGTLIIGNGGESSELELPSGTYWVKETAAPPGYAVDPDKHKVKIESEETTVFEAEDTPITAKIDILIDKTPDGYPHDHGEGDASLKNAVFKVDYYDDPGDQHVMRAEGQNRDKALATWYFLTDENGKVRGSDPKLAESYTSSALYKDDKGKVVFPLGRYVVKEVKAPKGYLLNEEEFTVTVAEDGTGEKYTTAYNSAEVPENIIKGGVKIFKIDAALKSSVPQGDASLAGAEFTIYNDSDHSIIVGGTEYAKGKAVMTITTDEDGIAHTSKKALPYGTYKIKETKAPEGYLLNEDWEASFKVREDGQTVELSDSKAEDSVILGAVKIYKVDSDLLKPEPQGDASLEGAEFTIFNKSAGTVVIGRRTYEPNEAVMTLATDKDGMIETEMVLPYGTYSIKETKASEGYLLNADWEVTFKIRKPRTTIEIADNKAKEAVIRGGVRIFKIDDELEEASSQGDGTLKDAEFTITNISASSVVIEGRTVEPGEDALVISTGEDGVAASAADALPYGTYMIRETKASEGYLLNEEWQETFEIREDGKIVELTDEKVGEEIKRSGIRVIKLDKELGKSEALGGASLDGIVMTIRNVSDHEVLVRKDLGSDDKIDWRKGDIKTLLEAGEVRRVDPGEDVGSLVIHWNEDINAYSAETFSDDLPYGTYTIRETATNDTYQRTDLTEHRFEVREDGKLYTDEDLSELLIFEDQVYRSDVQGTKIGDSTSERFGLVPFKITSLTNGESHVVVTDRNGFFSTNDRRTEDQLNETEESDNMGMPNSFDDLLEADEISIESMEARADDVLLGVWFGTGENGSVAEPSEGLGALPYDTYILEELSCERNAGYTLQKFMFTVDQKSVSGLIDLETITDDVPEIGTVASVDGRSTDLDAAKTIKLIDTVEYSGLKRNERYIAKGRLIDRATGEAAHDADGKEITAETEFTAGSSQGRIKVTFVFDGSRMQGMDTVVFERLYDSQGHLIAKHEDPDDDFQRLTWKEDKPEEPTGPDEPSEPENPDKPSAPYEPDTPSAPDTPDKPDKPDVHDTPGTPIRTKVPKTGDELMPELWLMVFALSCTAALRIRMRRDE
ncbi:MAG: VaFE repeat-containing surface-anchored protein [Firmicutes bacterium]|nr:VaFE repeat-containing surface-anchored protein [Bacillota bacterium]